MLTIEDRLAAAERRIAAMEQRLGRDGPWYPEHATARFIDGCNCPPGGPCGLTDCPRSSNGC